MNREDKLLLEVYKAIGTPEEIIKRLDSPYPAADGGYAPVPWEENFEEDGRPDSGLLVDDEIGMSSSPYEGSTIVVDDWGGA